MDTSLEERTGVSKSILALTMMPSHGGSTNSGDLLEVINTERPALSEMNT